jgi:hypothetical protein
MKNFEKKRKKLNALPHLKLELPISCGYTHPFVFSKNKKQGKKMIKMNIKKNVNLILFHNESHIFTNWTLVY